MEAIRTAVLNSVKDKSPEEFVQLFYRNSSSTSLEKEDDLQDFALLLPEEQQTELWDDLSAHVINAVISETALNSTGGRGGGKVPMQVLQVTIRLAQQALSIRECIVPQPLFQSVLLLHGYVLASEHDGLKEKMAALCETWWHNNIEGRESLTSVPLMYLMEKCLVEKPSNKSIGRLWKLHDALATIDHCSGSMVWDAMLNLCAHTAFVKTTQGQKFLSHVLVTQPTLVKKMHQTIKYNIGQSSAAVAEDYASIAMNAWSNCESVEVKDLIETDIIQDFMYSAIHIQRKPGKSLHISLMKYMSKIHSMKLDAAVSAMLDKLYKPFLWRSLHAANADIRANAAKLFLDALPLIDRAKGKQKCEERLQKQFDLLVDLLEDEDHVVREVTVSGTCGVLSRYAEHIPYEVTSDLMNILFTKLAWDQSSVAVRVTVIQAVSLMLDNPANHVMLASMLPTLSDLLHNVSEKVRLAFARLLLKVKHIRMFKIWKIVSKEHVFGRLEIDTPDVCVKLVELTYKSFISDNLENHIQLERCIELIETDLTIARKFYRYIVVHINIQQAVQFMLLLRKCIMTCVNKHTRTVKENRQPSLCSALANLTAADTYTSFANFSMINNNITQFTDRASFQEEEEELTVDNTQVMKGLFDVICIIWDGFNKELNMASNVELKDILRDKFTRSLIECFHVFKDEEIEQSLLYIASFLPSTSSSTLRKHVEKTLRNLPQNNSINKSACSSLVLCMCQWGATDKLLDMIYRWAAALSSPRGVRRSSRDEQSGNKLRSVIDVMGCILSHPTCITSIKLADSQLELLFDRLSQAQVIVRRCVRDCESHGYDTDILLSLLTIHSKLVLILHQSDQEKLLLHLKELSSTLSNYCLAVIKSTEEDPAPPPLVAKKSRRLLDLQEEAMCSNDSIMSAADTDGSSYVRDLSTKATNAILIIIVNFLVVHELSCEALRVVCDLCKHSHVFFTAGLSSTIYELLVQLTKSAVLSESCKTRVCAELLGNSWTQVIQATFVNILDVEFLSGKKKTGWLNLLQSINFLAPKIRQAVAKVLVTSMVSLLDEEQITPTLSRHLQFTLNCSKTLQGLIVPELELMSNECCEETASDNIKMLIEMVSTTR